MDQDAASLTENCTASTEGGGGNSSSMLANITQEMVAEWLARLQHRAGGDRHASTTATAGISGSSSGSHLDDLDLAVEVQEFLPEEEIAVIDVGDDANNELKVSFGDPFLMASNDEMPAISLPSPREPTPPPMRPPAIEQPPLSYELMQGQRILRELMGDSNKSFVRPFVNPMDPSIPGSSSYYQHVKNPVCMRQMKEKFETGVYQTITEFVADMRLMLENCYRYIGPDHPISRKAQRIETLLGQKLNLLSRELREKTTLTATSGKGLRELQHGSRRLKILALHDSSALLNELRREAAARDREKRRQHMIEKRQSYELFLQSLQSWEDSLLEGQQLGAMWEIPQICQFVLLCVVPLGVGEVPVYELERSFLMPRESSTLQRIITSLLSTPFQRTRLENKASMPYRVWNTKVTLLVRQWYKVLNDTGRHVNRTCQKTGVEEKFFKVMGMTNPLDYRQFHELSVYQRVWVIKSLCDYCVETQQCLCDAIEAQPSKDHHEMLLGVDADGYSYIHFPLFCGADLRIYRQKVVQVAEETSTDAKRRRLRSSRRSRRHRTHVARPKPSENNAQTEQQQPQQLRARRDSRLRQNPRQVQAFQVEVDNGSDASDGSETEEAESNDDENGSSDVVDEDDDVDPPPSKRVARSSDSHRTPPTRSSDRRSNRIESASVTDSATAKSDATTAEGSAMLRRSLRKVIEESKKDAAPSSSVSVASSRESTPQRSVSGGRRSSLRNRRKPTPAALTRAAPNRTPTKSTVFRKLSDAEYDDDNDMESDFDPSIAEALSVSPQRNSRRTTRRSGGRRRRTAAARRQKSSAGKIVPATAPASLCDVDSVSGKTASETNVYKDADDSVASSLSRLHGGNPDVSQSVSGVDLSDPDSQLSTACSGSEKMSEVTGKSAKTDLRHRDSFGMLQSGVESDELSRNSDMESDVKPPPSFVEDSISSKETSDGKSRVEISENDRTSKPSDTKTDLVFRKSESANVIKEESAADEDFKDVKADEKLKGSDAKADNEVKTNDASGGKMGVEKSDTDTNGKSRMEKEEADGKDVEMEEDEKNVTSGDNVEELPAPPTVKEEPPEILGPDVSEFQLVADSVASLRNLVAKFTAVCQAETPPRDSQNKEDGTRSSSSTKRLPVAQLHARLSSLLLELEPFEQKLVQLNKKMKIKMRKELENYCEEPSSKQQAEDEWHSSASSDSSEEEDRCSSAVGSTSRPSTPSQPQPSEPLAGTLRNSRRRFAAPSEGTPATRSGGGSRNRKRQPEQPSPMDSTAAKRSKNVETAPTDNGGPVNRRSATSTKTGSRSGATAARGSAAPVPTAAAGSRQRAVLRITQPDGNVCFIAIDNVSDLSRLPVTAVVQQLLASQKSTTSPSNLNHRLPSISTSLATMPRTIGNFAQPHGNAIQLRPAVQPPIFGSSLSVATSSPPSTLSAGCRLSALLSASHPTAPDACGSQLVVDGSSGEPAANMLARQLMALSQNLSVRPVSSQQQHHFELPLSPTGKPVGLLSQQPSASIGSGVFPLKMPDQGTLPHPFAGSLSAPRQSTVQPFAGSIQLLPGNRIAMPVSQSLGVIRPPSASPMKSGLPNPMNNVPISRTVLGGQRLSLCGAPLGSVLASALGGNSVTPSANFITSISNVVPSTLAFTPNKLPTNTFPPGTMNQLSAVPLNIAGKTTADGSGGNAPKVLLFNVPASNMQALLPQLVAAQQRPIFVSSSAGGTSPTVSSVGLRPNQVPVLVNIVATQGQLLVSPSSANTLAQRPQTQNFAYSSLNIRSPTSSIFARPSSVRVAGSKEAILASSAAFQLSPVSNSSLLSALTSRLQSQPVPRYTGGLTVKALLEGRLMSSPAAVRNLESSCTMVNAMPQAGATSSVVFPSVVSTSLAAAASNCIPTISSGISIGISPIGARSVGPSTALIHAASRPAVLHNGPQIATVQPSGANVIRALIPMPGNLTSMSMSNAGGLPSTIVGRGISQKVPSTLQSQVAAVLAAIPRTAAAVSGAPSAAPSVVLVPQLVSVNTDIGTLRAIIPPTSRVRPAIPQRAVRNNTLVTNVMRAPIPALPRLTDLSASSAGSAMNSTTASNAFSMPNQRPATFAVTANQKITLSASSVAPVTSSFVPINPSAVAALTAGQKSVIGSIAGSATVVRPPVSGQQNVLLLQSANGIIQLVQLPASAVGGNPNNLLSGQFVVPQQQGGSLSLMRGSGSASSPGQNQVVLIRPGTGLGGSNPSVVSSSLQRTGVTISSAVRPAGVRLSSPVGVTVSSGGTRFASLSGSGTMTAMPATALQSPVFRPAVPLQVAATKSLSTNCIGGDAVPTSGDDNAVSSRLSLSPVGQPSCLAEAANLFLMAANAVDHSHNQLARTGMPRLDSVGSGDNNESSLSVASVRPSSSSGIRPSPLVNLVSPSPSSADVGSAGALATMLSSSPARVSATLSDTN